MRYSVEVGGQAGANGGERVEVEVRDGPSGVEVSVAGRPFVPARLVGCPAPLHALELGDARRAVVIEPDPIEPGGLKVALEGRAPVRALALDARAAAAAAGRASQRKAGPSLQRSPMPGVIVEVRVSEGSEVEKGDVLLILEAMKMQNELQAERAGVIDKVHVTAGEAVAAGAKLVEYVKDPEA